MTTTLDAERTEFLAELAAARSALTNTVSGLTDQQAAATPTASALCLGGLIKHVTGVEQNWLRFVLEGPSAFPQDLPDGVTWADIAAGTASQYPQWMLDHQSAFHMHPGDTLDAVLARYEQVATHTAEIIATVPDLTTTHPLPALPWHQPGAQHSVRRVLIHLIAETAQHAGHAQIIRETIDGTTAM